MEEYEHILKVISNMVAVMPLDLLLFGPVEQCRRLLHESVIRPAMDHGREGAGRDLSRTNAIVAWQGSRSHRYPNVDFELASTVVDHEIANQGSSGDLHLMLLKERKQCGQGARHMLRNLTSLQP